jgi:hypothetical protein
MKKKSLSKSKGHVKQEKQKLADKLAEQADGIVDDEFSFEDDPFLAKPTPKKK